MTNWHASNTRLTSRHTLKILDLRSSSTLKSDTLNSIFKRSLCRMTWGSDQQARFRDAPDAVEYCTISFNSDVTHHRPPPIVRNVTNVLCHIALVRKHWRAPMLNMAIKGPLWRRAGGGMILSPSFWKVSETKISDKVSHVTPLSELNEMVQYKP